MTARSPCKDPRHEKRYPSRLPHDRRQDDGRHDLQDALDLGRRGRHALARHRSHRAPRMDRRLLAPDGHRRPRVEVQEKIRRSWLLSRQRHRVVIKRRSGPGRRFFFETDQLTVADKTRTLRDRVWPFGKPFTDGPFRLILLIKKSRFTVDKVTADTFGAPTQRDWKIPRIPRAVRWHRGNFWAGKSYDKTDLGHRFDHS